MTDGMVDQIRAMSVGAVRSATDAARTALEGMQNLGRSASDMIVPATRRTARVATGAGRTAVDTASRGTRTMSRTMRRAASTGADAASTARSTTRAAARTTRGTTGRTTRKRTTKKRRAA